MYKYIITRIVLMFVTLFIILTSLYYVINIIMYLRTSSGSLNEIINSTHSLYFNYLKGIINDWDFGISARYEEIWPTFKRKAVYTVGINLIALFFYVSVGLFLGTISATKKDKLADNIIGVITNIFSACHPIILTFALMLILGYTWHLVPTIFLFNIESLSDFTTFIIPVISLSLEPIANITRITRGELIENLNTEYVLSARIKGLKKGYIVRKHALRNCAAVIIPTITTTFVHAMFNSFFLEWFYNIPGLATWFMESIVSVGSTNKYISMDLNVVLIICLFYTILGLLISFILDIIYKILDPRIKIGAKKLYIES